MNLVPIETLALLRVVVGFLGEHDQFGWWPSRFLHVGSRPFLAPVFSRTLGLAQCVGVTRAAARVHDERIGLGRVGHLFRLPEEVEQELQRTLASATAPLNAQLAASSASPAAALAYLEGVARQTTAVGVGPTRVEVAHDLRDARVWQTVAALYAHAFATQTPVFPYVSVVR